jgi:ABC-type bacteriocin/lantibiotic exporter with double-glycine peptidase domain
VTMPDPKILDHLVEIARFHGLPADRKRLDYEYSVGTEPLNDTRFRRMAQDLGLVVSPRALSWRRLRGLGNAYPAILLLPSGRWVLHLMFESKEFRPSVLLCQP